MTLFFVGMGAGVLFAAVLFISGFEYLCSLDDLGE